MITRLLLGLMLLGATSGARALDDSLSELEQAVRDYPTEAPVWDRLGQALARQGHYGEAQEAFSKALQYAPDSKEIGQHIALAYAWSGDYQEAEKHYVELLARYPRDSTILLDYGETLAWDRRFNDARRQFESVLAEDPQHVEALRHLGLLTAWQGRYDEALGLLDRALKLDQHNVRLLLAQGEILSWKGDLVRAARALELAREIAPGNASALLKLAQVYAWEGRTREAQETYQQAIALDPANVEGHLGLAHVYMGNHQYREAEKVLRQALAMFPTDPRLSKDLATLAADKTLGLADIIDWLQPLLFIFILIVIYWHVSHYRRVLHQYNSGAYVLLATLPVLAALTLVTYAFVMLGGSYYREVAIASRVLQLLSMLILVVVLFWLVWLLRFARPVRNQVVLAIGAHPDDIEFGAGATLLHYREQGCRTYGLVLTNGERGNGNDGETDSRTREARQSAQVIALLELRLLSFPDTRLHICKADVRRVIESALRELSPDVILTHTPHDVHSDHKTVFEVTREAARGAYTILCYENPNTPPEFKPDYFVDVSDYLDDKIKALARHKTQSQKPYTDPKVIRAAAAFRGAQARVKYAEAFETLRVLEKTRPA